MIKALFYLSVGLWDRRGFEPRQRYRDTTVPQMSVRGLPLSVQFGVWSVIFDWDF
jgi:hypothetical protein